MRTTTLMRILQVSAFQDFQNTPLNAKALTQVYSNLKLSASSEPVNEGFIDMALTCKKRLLSIPDMTKALVHGDSIPGWPLNRIAVLQAIIGKARTPTHIEWVVYALMDQFFNGDFKTTACPSLADFRKGDVVLMHVLKFSLKQYLLGEFMTRQCWSPEVCQNLLDVLDFHKAYRSRCGYSPNALEPPVTTVDESFRVVLPLSADAGFKAIEELVYGSACNQMLLTAAAAGKRAIDVVGTGRFKELIDAALTCREIEIGIGTQLMAQDDNTPELPDAWPENSLVLLPPETTDTTFKTQLLDTLPRSLSTKVTDDTAGVDTHDWQTVEHQLKRKLKNM